MAKLKKNLTIDVNIIKMGEIVYTGKVMALTSEDEKGVFDILPLHGNFIALVNKKIILHEVGGKKKEIKIDSGVLRNHHNRVDILLGIKIEAGAKPEVAARAAPPPPPVAAPPPPPLAAPPPPPLATRAK